MQTRVWLRWRSHRIDQEKGQGSAMDMVIREECEADFRDRTGYI